MNTPADTQKVIEGMIRWYEKAENMDRRPDGLAETAALRAALADVRRMEWLGADEGRTVFNGIGGEWIADDGPGRSFAGDTARAAIDAALQEETAR